MGPGQSPPALSPTSLSLMEEPYSVPETQNPGRPKPEGAEESAASTADPQSTKRKLEDGEFHNSKYVKLRAIIKDLRPFILEVIHAPDFRESKAAHDIRKQMKIMIELSKQLRNETASSAKPKKLPEEQPLAGADKEKHVGNHQEGENRSPQSQNGAIPSLSDNTMEKMLQSEKILSMPDKIPGAATEEKIPELKEYAKLLEEGFQGTYVIGGSPIGWNFLVYPGSKPVYYGETKASFLSRQAAK